MRPTLIGFLLLTATVRCATGPELKPLSERAYTVSSNDLKSLIANTLAKRGIKLVPTDDPNVMVSEPSDGQTKIMHVFANNPHMLSDEISNQRVQQEYREKSNNRSDAASNSAESSDDGRDEGNPGMFGPEDTNHLVQYRVTLMPSATGTAVKVERSDQFGWAKTTEYNSIVPPSYQAGYVMPEFAPLDARATRVFHQDRNLEAAVASVLDGQIDLEINSNERTDGLIKEPLPDVTVEALPSVAVALDACPMKVSALGSMIRPGHVLLLSDPFGANEAWLGTESVLCEAARRTVPVTVALGLLRIEQRSLNEYLQSDGGEAARARLLESPSWHRQWQDGRSSKATLAFIEHVRALRRKGAQVSVLTYEPNAVSGNARQGSIASVLLRYREQQPDRLLIFVNGNVSVSKNAGTSWDSGFLSVGARLHAVLPEQTHSFDVAYDRGDKWCCRADNRSIRCGTFSAAPGPAQTRSIDMVAPQFRAFETLSKHGFDGVMYVGRLTTSVPALDTTFKDQGWPAVSSQR